MGIGIFKMKKVLTMDACFRFGISQDYLVARQCFHGNFVARGDVSMTTFMNKLPAAIRNSEYFISGRFKVITR